MALVDYCNEQNPQVPNFSLVSKSGDKRRPSLPDVSLSTSSLEQNSSTELTVPTPISAHIRNQSADNLLSVSATSNTPPPKPPLPLKFSSPLLRSSDDPFFRDLLTTADGNLRFSDGQTSRDSSFLDPFFSTSFSSSDWTSASSPRESLNDTSLEHCTDARITAQTSDERGESTSGDGHQVSRTFHTSSVTVALYSDHSDICGDPPKLPLKRKERAVSLYDNVVDGFFAQQQHQHFELAQQQQQLHQLLRQQQQHALSAASMTSQDSDEPPPLPPKRRTTVFEYMQTFGTYGNATVSHSSSTSQVAQSSTSSNGISSGVTTTNNNTTHVSFVAQYKKVGRVWVEANTVSPSVVEVGTSIAGTAAPSIVSVEKEYSPPPALPPKQNKIDRSDATPVFSPSTTLMNSSLSDLTISSSTKESQHDTKSQESNDASIEEYDVSKYIIFGENKSDALRGLKGGPVNALALYLTVPTDDKDADFIYEETFLTTYSTFMLSNDLIDMLMGRYNCFLPFTDHRQRCAKRAFNLLVRVVDDLGLNDVTDSLVQRLLDFSHMLLQRGDLSLARALREKIINKSQQKRFMDDPLAKVPLARLHITTKTVTILDFKSVHIAEQMTMLDNQLFQRIEISEVLLWAKLQNEEFSPNLTKFTEHFNKMSYWARQVLLEADRDLRDRVAVKFLKVMKHLRRANNFNSYLALLSALDSAPIRRLDWSRSVQEGLKEYCALIDSSASFRAYRQAVADTHPPCIPYIGLILQDLTFIHVGAADYLDESGTVINFYKCWQQYNTLEPLRKFKKRPFRFKPIQAIVDYFGDFECSLSEEDMWQLSEAIKPRGKK